jgi:uncharacterized protein (DUF885 family)
MSAKKTDITEDSSSEETYYIGISEPLEIRRTILETSKSIIQAMHRYEKYKSYRDEKFQLIKTLNKEMNELNTMISALKSALPKSTIVVKKAREEYLAAKKVGDVVAQEVKGNDVKVEISSTPKLQAPQVLTKTKKELSEIEKLELELSDIESKLSSLNK